MRNGTRARGVSPSRAGRRSRGRWRGRDGRRCRGWDLASLELADRGGDLAVGPKVLDVEDLRRGNDHRIDRRLELAATLYELRLRGGVGRHRKIEHVIEDEVLAALLLQPSEIHLATGKEHGLVRVPVDDLGCAGIEERADASTEKLCTHDQDEHDQRDEDQEHHEDPAERADRNDDRVLAHARLRLLYEGEDKTSRTVPAGVTRAGTSGAARRRE